MRGQHKIKGIIKRSIATFIGIIMTLSALMLPGTLPGNDFDTASAFFITTDDYIMMYGFNYETGEKLARIATVSFLSSFNGTFEIPSTITDNGVEYPLIEVSDNFLKGNTRIKTLIVPDTVRFIGEDVLKDSSVEKIVLPDHLERIGDSFADGCDELAKIECSGSDIHISDMGTCVLYNCHKMENEKGAVCLGNWLIKYDAPNDVTSVRITDLGTDGVPIDSIANFAMSGDRQVKTLDLENVKYISRSNFCSMDSLTEVKNYDNVTEIGDYVFEDSPWLEEQRQKDLVKLGTALLYYKTDSKTIDLTSGNLKDTTYVARKAFAECSNATTFLCSSNCMLNPDCFYLNYDQSGEHESLYDLVPAVPTYKISEIYLDGKPVKFSKDDPEMTDWIIKNYYPLRGVEWFKIAVESKAETLFEQLDLPFYGVYNDKIGTLSKTDEFYAMLKIHDYISTYDYDHNEETHSSLDSFLCGKEVNCAGYARLNDFLLECAGVRSLTLSSGITGDHAWNEVRIGDEWFECDPGWDEQENHSYNWLALSSSKVYEKDNVSHAIESTGYSWHNVEKIDRIIAERILGDINGDNDRNEKDAALLWDYLKGNITEISDAADINFDGTIDITDGVLLENFVNGQALEDPDNFPTDGLAAGFKVAFVNGDDYDNIEYRFTDRDGYIKLPAALFEAPEGKKLSYDIGMVGQKVKIHNPYQVIQTNWIDASVPDYSEPDESSVPDESSAIEPSRPDDSSIPDSSSISESSITDTSMPSDSSKPDKTGKLGDVNNDGKIDIEDAVSIIQHINGVKALTSAEIKRANVSGDNKIDIDDAVMIINYINGNSKF